MRRPSAPRRLSLHRVMTHADYVSSHVVGRSLLVSIAAIAVIHAFGIVTMGVSSMSALASMLLAAGILYAILAGLAVASMGDDLGQGYASLYLAHPLSRAEYFAAWMTAGPLVVLVAYLLSVAAPLIALNPSSLLDASVYLPVLCIAGQISFHTSVAVFSSILFKDKSKAILTLLTVIIIAPTLVVFVGGLLASAIHTVDIMSLVAKIVGVFHPAVFYMPFTPRGGSASLSLAYGFGASLILYYLGYRFFKYRTDI